MSILKSSHKPLKKLNRRQVIDSYRAAQRQGKNWKGYALPFSISSLRKQGGAPRWSRCRSSFSETGCPNGLTNVGCETNNQANCRANYVHQWLVGLCGALSLCHTRQSFMHKDHGRQPVWVPNWRFNADANTGHGFAILLASVGALRASRSGAG
jgi:hypothetical protein